ncbi:hypothetical protein EV193_10113 [Herbihabitans rhizosphaerae]|uniref:Uncharacterized protein n=1 Tax=Herbihabitans rhizosphaerae TaxID=1872711 RepID=A0A4Q7L3I1_9PSEU|nr:hypothetical protein [Herbihabitans rhizosphaerae]RZS44139.1 hypothetical protein EV193_10113 [Herbihabitans rhizosphaerae]
MNLAETEEELDWMTTRNLRSANRTISECTAGLESGHEMHREMLLERLEFAREMRASALKTRAKYKLDERSV